MGFWITVSIIIFVITMISTYGAYLGIYGKEIKNEDYPSDSKKTKAI